MEKAQSAPAAPIDDTDSELPTIAQTTVHLKLLHAIQIMRSHISNTDGLYGLYDSDVTNTIANLSGQPQLVGSQESMQSGLLELLKEKRWKIFVTAATKRFEVWWTALKGRYGGQALVTAHMREIAFDSYTCFRHKRILVRQEDLPPLDVLMVWHAFMLNPHCFLEDCLRQGMMSFWHNGMPWAAIDLCIDAATGSYEPGQAAEEAFHLLTELSWTPSETVPKVEIACPNHTCGSLLQVSLTTISRDNVIQCAVATATAGIQSPADAGWADAMFAKNCHKCGQVVNHDRIRAARCVKDLLLLKNGGRNKTDFLLLLPGTILDHRGAVKTLKDKEDKRYVPNQTMRAFLKSYGPKIHNINSMTDIHAVVDSHRRIKKRTFAFTLSPVARLGDLMVTNRYWLNFLSRYSENSSPFALDLAAAVLRQGSFIEKMEVIDWLHSSDLHSTITWILQKYERFFFIMANYVGDLAVPTIDVDLAWHTHQLNPYSYYAYSIKICDKFVDHDDSIGKQRLSNGFNATARHFYNHYGEPYAVCVCAECRKAAKGSHNAVNMTRHPQFASGTPFGSRLPGKGVGGTIQYLQYSSCGTFNGGGGFGHHGLGHHGGFGAGCGGGAGSGCGGGAWSGCGGGSSGGCGGGSSGGCGGGSSSGCGGGSSGGCGGGGGGGSN